MTAARFINLGSLGLTLRSLWFNTAHFPESSGMLQWFASNPATVRTGADIIPAVICTTAYVIARDIQARPP